jgi:GntR family transcriptional regulator of arabinose operon
VKTKFTSVFDALQREILDGKYGPDKRLPSESELAIRYKISRPTAARALRELQQLGVITRRAGSGSFLRTSQDREHKVQTGLTFGLLVPGLGSTEILDPICNEITRFAQSLGCQVLWGETGATLTTAEEALSFCRKYIELKVDGVFFAPIERMTEREACNRAIIDELRVAGIPVVLLDRDVPEFPQRSELDLVAIDNLMASIAMTDHLLRKGCRRICFLGRPHFPSTTALRRLGCEEALRRAAIAPDYPVSHFGEPNDTAFVKALLKSARPDAIVCSNDQVAAVLLQTLGVLNIRVPENLRVAGFDDVRYATLLAVPLSTMHQPCRDIGRIAVKRLVDRVVDPTLPAQQVLLEATLIARASTA